MADRIRERFGNTNPERYHADAAREAWTRTLNFFKQHLQG
jgi:dienelactone hydrolase